MTSRDEWSPFAQTVMQERYAWLKNGTRETWPEIAQRVATNVMGAVGASKELTAEVAQAIASRKLMPGGRYLYASGRDFHQVQNCLLLRAEDSREGWADLLSKVTMALMTGAGIGVVYSDLRAEGAPIKRTGGYSSGPLALMQAVNEVGRSAKQGGNRRAAIWAGLHWNHPDVMRFIALKDWSDVVKGAKASDFNFPAPMDHTNISVILDDAFFAAYATGEAHAREVYWAVIRHACETGEPGFSVDVGRNTGENLRNACTEVTSHDDSDICNLASINLARIENRSEMAHLVEIGTAFLTAGTVYSDLPYAKVEKVREKNRRLGLGLMGVHEWLMRAGKRYGEVGPSLILDEYSYATSVSRQWAWDWELSESVKTRAIAPTGTIGIVAETTTGIEPMFCAAYKRRYYDHGTWRHQYVVDPTAKRLMAEGIDPGQLEDAYSLSRDIERRVRFQAQMQRYVDHGISSTLNLPAWGSPENNPDTVKPFGEMLLAYLPSLRGITVYPDGARGGQPLTPCDPAEALKFEGQVLTEQTDVCDLRGGSCGS